MNEELKQLLLSRENGNGGAALYLQGQVKQLEEKLEEAHRAQHDLENVLEEYEVNYKKMEESVRQNNKKFHELQKKYGQAEQARKATEDKNKKLEADKTKLSEKWIRLSSKNKQEERQKSRIRELEQSKE